MRRRSRSDNAMAIPLAILWHQHQPCYKDLASGELVMPWARLHGIKDYYGMARLLELHGGMKCGINLVPSLVAQLLDYVEHGATDPFLRRARMPAEDLGEEDVRFVLDRFFMAQWDRMIRPHARYRELLEMRRFGRRSAASAGRDFSAQDLRDLQVWFHLAWFHPLCFEEWEALRGLRDKARSFSESDKAELFRVHDRVLARILPLHRELHERGQVELTTTPFYHPILPLLCDMESARAAMPQVLLPAGHRPAPEDAEAQLAKAVALHKQVFGHAPAGLWPAEGAVSPEVVSLAARHGIRWMATDEEILSVSLGVGLRAADGRLERPELLYRPWKIASPDAGVAIVFRDHHFSDLIGFQYQRWDGEGAANDLLGRVASAAGKLPDGDQALVTIILDGENCWEHYPEQGLKFLQVLYARLQDGCLGLKPVRIGEQLAAHPPARTLEKLFPGSWINHDFYIWIGHAEDRRAWEYLFRVRDELVAETRKRGQPAPPPAGRPPADAALARAWEELYVAEGSDWFWWYGDDHTSGQDDAFDELFRRHLKNVYRFLGQPAPYFLEQPIAAGAPMRFTAPRGPLRVMIDGRATSYFEWLGAGVYKSARDGGVMNSASTPLLAQIIFGYDRESLCVRVDPHDEPLVRAGPPTTGRTKRVALSFTEPRGPVLVVERGPPVNLRVEGAWPTQAPKADAAWGDVLEVRLPLAALGLAPGKEVAFFVEAEGGTGAAERFPRAGALHFALPPAEAEEGDWVV